MITQKFKGDDTELKMEAAAKAAFDSCSGSLDDYLEGGYNAADFLLMLYDEGRMPFSERVPRDSFVSFFRQAVPNFPFTGTFESYIFILTSIFGAESLIFFEVEGPGKLSILVNASDLISFDAIARDLQDGVFVTSDLVTDDGDQIVFSGIPGIDNQSKLNQLLSELIPNGVFTEITLAFFTISSFVAEEGGDFYNMTDHLGNQIVFFETGE